MVVNMKMRIKLGGKLAMLRNIKSLTAKQVAKSIGVSPAMLCGIEKGDKAVTMDRLLALSDVLNVPVCVIAMSFMYEREMAMLPENVREHAKIVFNEFFKDMVIPSPLTYESEKKHGR